METNITKPRCLLFLTDKQVDLLVAYLTKEKVVSRDALLSGEFGLTPERIRSLVLSNILDEIGEGKNLRYRAGKLFFAVRTYYRYGSKTNTFMDKVKTIAYRTREDWERAYMFQPGDVVTSLYKEDNRGTVMDVLPAQRKVLVRWTYGTELEDADMIILKLRDSGLRQIDVPLIDKDIIDDYPHNSFTIDKDLYKLERDKFQKYSLEPLVLASKEADTFTKSIHTGSKKVEPGSITNFRYSGAISGISEDRLKRIASSFTKNGSSPEELNSEYLLTQAEIIVSCNTEKRNPLYKRTPWYVTENTAMNINDNGNGWTSELLAKTYHTFRGAYNFYEHEQNIAQSKGRVIDAVLRKIPVGQDEHYYSVEILVATNRKFKNLVDRIVSGNLKTLSMGCSAAYTVCSYCGNVSYTPETRCDHIMYQRGQYFFDQHGNKRIIAELCGSDANPDSIEFEEASFVEVPAWRNAKVHNIISKSTSLVNVVGYLSTRLYDKNSVEFILGSGTLKDVSLPANVARASLDLGAEPAHIKLQSDFDFGMEDEETEVPAGDVEKPETLGFELSDKATDKSRFEGLMEENIRTSSKKR